ncbi:tyrosine-type recombinase/integrase [Azospirillum canadense]|uniref:tyrosine-type recombinase/integrase n=1 Tax=Azospirillum canadense TaxID=403962 RepID=UPI0022266390|nr:integrase family protein [Azospirillum canadense]MCW2238165.1 integrase [Azospirillum canadense]
MPKVKLTKTSIAKAVRTEGKQLLLWDTDLKGFGLLLSGKTDAKTFVVQRDIGGKTRRVTIGPANVMSLEDARKRAEQILKQFYDGIDPKQAAKAKAELSRTQGLTLRQALDSMLMTRKNLSPKTVLDYRGSVTLHLSDWADKPIATITTSMVLERHRRIQVEVAKRRAQRMKGEKPIATFAQNLPGAPTANGVMRALKAIWNHARLLPGISLGDNPVRIIGASKAWFEEKPRTDRVRFSLLPKFYKSVMELPNQIHRDYILLLLFTGLRRENGLSLRWTDVDFEERMIRLESGRTKNGAALDLPMSDFVYDLLQARKQAGNDGGWVFPANSKSGHLEEPRYALETVCAASGIHVTVHGLRRTFAAVAEESGITVLALKALINHSLGNDVTARHYVQLTPERLRKPMEIVAANMKAHIGVNAYGKSIPEDTQNKTAQRRSDAATQAPSTDASDPGSSNTDVVGN